VTYRTPVKQAEADSDRGSVAKADVDWAWRFFLIILSSLLATIVVILVQDVKQGRRCERYGERAYCPECVKP
jgi:hypothetical protein